MSDSTVIKHTPKLWERRYADNSLWLFWCPGCGRGHVYQTPRWTFDGNVDYPTFSPSLLMFTTELGSNVRKTECHLFVKAGMMAYCSDNPHTYNGQTMPMLDIPPDYGF